MDTTLTVPDQQLNGALMLKIWNSPFDRAVALGAFMVKSHHLTLLALLLAAGMVLPSAPASADTFTGLLGYWSFNGTAADQSGNRNNLSLFGGATFASGGQFGQALSLNGVPGTYAQQTTNNTAFDFGSNNFAIQVWANFASKNSEQTLIEKFSTGAGPGWTFTTPGQQIEFYAANAGNLYSSGVSYQTGVWEQFVAERNGNNMYIYFNDRLVATGSFSGSITPSTNPLLIGARNSGDGRNFTVNGLIDDVGIWDRALSSAEIDALWNGGNGLAFQSSVPEPSTWAMMLLGFCGLGFLACRGKSKVSLRAA